MHVKEKIKEELRFRQWGGCRGTGRLEQLGIEEEAWRAEILGSLPHPQLIVRSVGRRSFFGPPGEYSLARLSASNRAGRAGVGAQRLQGEVPGRAAEGSPEAKASLGALGRPGVPQQVIQVTLEDANFLAQLGAGRLLQAEQDFGEFRQRQQTEPLLVVGGDDFQGRPEQL